MSAILNFVRHKNYCAHALFYVVHVILTRCLTSYLEVSVFDHQENRRIDVLHHPVHGSEVVAVVVRAEEK